MTSLFDKYPTELKDNFEVNCALCWREVQWCGKCASVCRRVSFWPVDWHLKSCPAAGRCQSFIRRSSSAFTLWWFPQHFHLPGTFSSCRYEAVRLDVKLAFFLWIVFSSFSRIFRFWVRGGLWISSFRLPMQWFQWFVTSSSGPRWLGCRPWSTTSSWATLLCSWSFIWAVSWPSCWCVLITSCSPPSSLRPAALMNQLVECGAIRLMSDAHDFCFSSQVPKACNCWVYRCRTKWVVARTLN